MGWVTKGLEDVLFIQEGPGIRKYEYEEGGYPMINVRCVQDGYIDMSKSRSANTELALGKWKHFQVEEGDILYTISGTIGRSAIVKKSDLPLLMNTSVVRFRSLSKDLDTKFTYYYFKTNRFINELLGHSTGTAIKNVGPSHLKKMTISYPSLAEQRNIVSALEQSLPAIENAITTVEKNIMNASELFESFLQKIFLSTDSEWTETKLGKIASFKNGLNFSQNSKGEFLKVVGVKDFKSNFMVPTDELDTIQIDGTLDSSYQLQKGDIVTVRSNGNKRLIGRCLLVGELNSKTSYSGFTIRIRLDINNLVPEFLTYYMKSKDIHELLIGSGGGANISNLNQKVLNNLPIKFPDRKIQQTILERIKAVETECSVLTDIYLKKLDALNALKQSILQQAFNGELTNSKGAAA